MAEKDERTSKEWWIFGLGIASIVLFGLVVLNVELPFYSPGIQRWFEGFGLLLLAILIVVVRHG